MKSIKELRGVRAEKSKALKALVDPTRTWEKEKDKPAYEALMAEYDDIDAQIKRIETVNARLVDDAMSGLLKEASEKQLKDGKSPERTLYAKWLRGGDNDLTAADWS